MGVAVVITETHLGPGPVVPSPAALAARLATTGLAGVRLLVDEQLAGSPVEDSLCDALTAAGGSVRTAVAPRAPQVETLSHEAARLRDGDAIVALGGGLVIDQAKIISLLAAEPGGERRLVNGHRCGFVAVPNAVRRRTGLAIVPSTLGTGAELSHSACLEHEGRKKLVYGSVLRADTVLHTADATRTLPTAMVMEGIAEAVLRLVGGYVGTRARESESDRLCLTLAARLTALGDVVHEAEEQRVPVQDDVLVEIAGLSGASHSSVVTDHREPYSDICWPLANELSTWLGCRKVGAMAALTPVLWELVESGDRRLGSVDRLRSVWGTLRASSVHAVGDRASAGLATLFDTWGIGRPAHSGAGVAEALAQRAAHAWGRGLPMLRGLTIPELTRVYAVSLSSPARTMTAPRVPSIACARSSQTLSARAQERR